MNAVQPVAVVVHHRRTDTRWTECLLAQRGLPALLVRTYQGDPVPDPAEVSGVVCLGGPQNAYGAGREPHLAAEEEFLGAAVAADRPVLGICLGAQLLANALGGAALPGAEGPEYGEIDVTVDPRTDDPVLAGRSGRYFSYHRDSFRLPPGATLLAWSARYPQAFRLGSALGLQFHPEISPEGVRALVDRQAEELAATGLDPALLRTGAERARELSWRKADALVGGWLDREVLG